MEPGTDVNLPLGDVTGAVEPASSWRLQTHGSKMVEQALEYQLLAALTRELLRRGMSYEILRADFDTSGYDVVIEAGAITRHIQLKACIVGGKASRVPIHTALASKPSGCVIRMRYDPESLTIEDYGWFGDLPGAPLPPLGDKIVHHSRGNSQGVKAARPMLRYLPVARFATVADTASLLDKLFG